MIQSASPFNGLCAVGFLARASYALARTPVLALFAASLGAGPEAIGFCVAISTITGIFFKMPAGVVADVLGKPGLCSRGWPVLPLSLSLISWFPPMRPWSWCGSSRLRHRHLWPRGHGGGGPGGR